MWSCELHFSEVVLAMIVFLMYPSDILILSLLCLIRKQVSLALIDLNKFLHHAFGLMIILKIMADVSVIIWTNFVGHNNGSHNLLIYVISQQRSNSSCKPVAYYLLIFILDYLCSFLFRLLIALCFHTIIYCTLAQIQPCPISVKSHLSFSHCSCLVNPDRLSLFLT